MQNNNFKKMAAARKFSCKSGYNQLRKGDMPLFREKLRERLGMSTMAGVYGRIRGEVEPRATEVVIIEETFAEFGITNNIWDM